MVSNKSGPLNFIGTGSAFNYKLGNNSAYIKRNSTLLLIDCGDSVFQSLGKLNLLQGIKHLYVAITHMHPDHIGSLGEVILYNQHILQIRTTLIYPDSNSLKALLTAMGVNEEYYDFLPICDTNATVIPDININLKYIIQDHTNSLKCFAYILQLNNKKIFYSGDGKSIPATILEQLSKNQIDYLYQDTCSYDSNDIPHLSLNKLTEIIPANLRHKVYCMHLDDNFDVNMAKSLGFNVVVNCYNG
ncbi:MAG: MBL fold metallo-hydrolase [Clostridiales bacterium]|uniref:MBL fold metallo-hydrolase n=1 Tax=Clostridium sp. N3C TaxID=1776758 RepID=UPI00092E0C7A|nr:MBL fold metallo-hydrolase [Clostridium sp. N3C]NLZ48562.1 MBL fold metallo-hydrolase [Clostridiales bacterium]SCN26043.1 ribonuclease Z [Clostridium sp. N3C]